MLALQSYEQASGFSVLTADELYYVNGGSLSTGAATAIIIGCAVVGIVGGALSCGATVAAAAAAAKVVAAAAVGGGLTGGLAGAGVGTGIVAVIN